MFNQEATVLLQDEIYNDMLSKITGGVWENGAKIPSENTLCKEYGCSRVTIRSAIQRLQVQNLIITQPGRGSFVISDHLGENVISAQISRMEITKNEYRYLVELRRAIEYTAIDLMSQYGNDDDFAQLKQALDDMRAAGSDTDKYTDADYRFHRAIITGSHNPLFTIVMDGIKETLYHYYYEMAVVSNGHFEKAIENHTRIYQNLVNRKPRETKQVIEGTFEYNLARFKDSYKD